VSAMGNRNFRDPAYRITAQRARDNGHGKAHASWRRDPVRRDISLMDNFDLWLHQVEQRVKDIMADARLDYLRATEGCDDIPF
jgi:hypothetical protein